MEVGNCDRAKQSSWRSPDRLEYVSIVRQAVEGVARRICFDAVQVQDIKLAVGEACTNAVEYGCPSDEAHNVQVRCEVRIDGLMIEVSNNISGCSLPRACLGVSRPDPRGRLWPLPDKAASGRSGHTLEQEKSQGENAQAPYSAGCLGSHCVLTVRRFRTPDAVLGFVIPAGPPRIGIIRCFPRSGKHSR